MQPSFIIFDKFSQAKQIVSRCYLLCPLKHGLESYPFYYIHYIWFEASIFNTNYLRFENNRDGREFMTIWSSPFFKAHECVNHPEHMEV